MNHAWLLTFGLGACAPEDTASGTAVGNLDVNLRFTTPSTVDVVGLTAIARLDRLSLYDCQRQELVLGSGLDVRLDGSTVLAIPSGTWCGAMLSPAAPPHWAATSSAGYFMDITLDLGPMTMRSTSPVQFRPGDTIVWAFGDQPWLDAQALGADVADVVIAPGDPRHDALVRRVRGDQALVRDEDDDGERDDDDDVLGEIEDEDEG